MNTINIDLKDRAFNFSVNIIKLIDSLKCKDFTFQSILNQLIRSATSIGANVNEAQGGISKKDFTVFFRHAFKSAIETEYWLALIKEAKNIDTNILINDCQILIRILAKSLKTLKEN